MLIKQAKIVDPNSPHNGKTVDILIEKGSIAKIGKNLPLPSQGRNDKLYKEKNLHVSPGWFDLRANFRDPGLEHKEDLNSGIKAAIAGGFTSVALMPSTNPPVDSKAGIDYIKNKTKTAIVDLHPIGTLSKGMKGTDLSEMYDMHLAGAVAFSDDKQSIANPELLKRTLLYAKGFGGLVMSFPNDKNIALNGNVNEEKTATMLGLKGIPALAEELAISRDLFLAEYTNAPIHFSTVSTAKSVELIRQAKKKGLNVTAEVTAHHLLLDDSALLEFDSNCKVMPPLRTKNDIKALIKGLKDGTIDAICSDHCPEDEESKKREFEHATFGIIGLETAFAVAMTALSKMLSLEEIIQKMAIRPREILRIKTPVIKEGETANLTLFNPTVVWTPTEKDIRSKSRNTPFIGTKLTGKALGIYNKGKFSEC